MVLATEVLSVLSRHILADGFPLVLDIDASKGSYFVDSVTGDRYLDFFTMYASMAVGYNHPRLLEVQDQLGRISVQKPSCSDAYTRAYAEFVETFSQTAIPAQLPHAFFIEGGALAVETSLKTAFDWKVRKNLARGNQELKGTKVIHFRQAFHGRSGYTLSLTNTHDQRKTKFFPIFDWPRIINPKLHFPLTDAVMERVIEMEQEAVHEILIAIEKEGDDIAAMIIEPIQGEGGDNHFRAEFLQQLRDICDKHEILLIFDEIQTGLGLTGAMWAFEHFGTIPDILCFGKKTQVCGILASNRIDEVEDNVFQESSRINSTFGGNLVDMVRCSHILRIIKEEHLVENARIQGRHLLDGLQSLAEEFPHLISNSRGRGLMCAFDLPDEPTRNIMIRKLFEHKILLLPCGERSIRFRPHLIVSKDEIDHGIDTVRQVLRTCFAHPS